MSFHVFTDRHLLPVGAATRRIRIDVRAPESVPRTSRPPLHLGLVLDRSGSMAGEKLALTRTAASQALHSLRSGDRFSVVLYNDTVTLLSPSAAVTPEAVARTNAALFEVAAQGYTDLGAGWLSGCGQVGAVGSENALGRCLLLTDGLANQGITDVSELESRAADLRRRGVTTSTFGVGADFDEVLLHRLADAGGGNFYFARDASQIPLLIAAETDNVLETVAREAVVRLRADERLQVASLNGDPCRREDDGFLIELGSLRSGESRTRVLVVDFPGGPLGSAVQVGLTLSDPDGILTSGERTLSWTRASATECADEAPDASVVHEAAKLEVALARMRALAEQRRGDVAASQWCLMEQIERLRREGGDDPRLQMLAQELERERATYGSRMDRISIKGRMFGAYRSMKFGLMEPSAGHHRLILRWIEPELAAVVERARSALAPEVAAWGVDVVERPVRMEPLPGPVLDVAEELRVVRAIAHAPTITIAFTNSRHHDNWFSHWHATERVALVSLCDWDRISAIPAAALAACEIVRHGWRLASPLYEPDRFMHAETRGCLFDFCSEKRDVEAKLRAGRICPQCTGRLANANINTAAVLPLLSAVQELARVHA